MPGIFISYRRDDTRADAGRLCDRLEAHFGDPHVFMDIDDLRPGEKFADVLRHTLDACDVLIVLMGRGWIDARDQNGSLRLMDEQDFVRKEVQTALQRGIEVIPVLVDRARMPTPESLPPALVALAGRQAIEISDSRFHQDVDRLLEVLDTLTSKKVGRLSRRTRLSALVALAVLAGALGWFGMSRWGSDSTQTAPPALGQSPGGITSLRSEPIVMSSVDVKAMLLQRNFFDAAWFPAGKGLDNDFEPAVLAGHPVIMDRRTNLMWQQSGSNKAYAFDGIAAYLQDLNKQAYAGHADWRLPTLEEALSLITPELAADAHISPLFPWRDAPIMWTADRAGDDAYWAVYSHDGIGRPERPSFNAWVRAVRTMR